MLVTLIVLYVGSQLVSTVMSTVSADKTQKYLMYGLPFFFVTFVFQLPGRPAPVLDHHEPVDDRAAADRPPPARPAAPAARSGRADPRRSGPGLLETLGVVA